MLHAFLALAATNPALFVGIVAVFVFFSILGVRKFRPTWWHWLEGHLAFLNGIDSNALFTFTWKALQAVPGALLGTLMTALASGGDPITMLLGALAGPVAAIGHEVLKRYSGKVASPKPLATLLMLFALAGVLAPVQGCASFKPADVAASVPNDVAIAYKAAGAALAVADVVNAAYMDSIQNPSQADVDREVAVTGKLVAIKQMLDVAKADLAHSREKLREAVSQLRDASALLQLAGVKAPPVVGEALSEAEKVLQ